MTRNLILDIQACQSELFRDRGCARYVAGLTDALIETRRVSAVTMNPSLGPARQLSERLTTSGLLGWETATNYRRLVRERPSAYFAMSPFENLAHGSILPPYLDVPLVVTLYDLIPMVMREKYLANPTTRTAYEHRLNTVRSADLVLALSEHTQHDAIEHLGIDPEKIAVIGAGVGDQFVPAAAGERPRVLAQKAIPGLRDQFVLCVTGADDNRKGVRNLLSAWARVRRQNHQLVIVCTLPDAQRRVWEQHAQSVGIARGDVLFTGFVPEDVLVALYQAAAFCVAPSLYEGFGLPIAEAARCHAPTIATRASSFPELVHEDALFGADDPVDAARVIQRALDDPVWRDELRADAVARVDNYTWRSVASRTLDAIDRVLPRGPRRRASRPRLALCTPLPPTLSGVADYTDRLLAPLAEHCELDVFVEGVLQRDATDPAALMRLPLDAFGDRFPPSAYDAVVHVIGGSVYHCRTARLAEAVPGIVWLHDIRLGGIYLTEAQSRARLAAELTRQYGEHVPASLLERWNDGLAYDEFGIGMTRAVVSGARAVLVNSRVAEAMLLADQAPDATIPPVHVLPFAIPARDPSVTVAREPDLVVVLGHLSPVRGTEIAVETIARLRVTRPDARLVFVGPAPRQYAAEIMAKAADVAPGAVSIVGEVPSDEYRGWIARASAALQLRTFSRGESSASVGDCLAMSTPVVTNAAACRELPAGSVRFLDDATPASAASALDEVLRSPPRTPAAQATVHDVSQALLEVVASLSR